MNPNFSLFHPTELMTCLSTLMEVVALLFNQSLKETYISTSSNNWKKGDMVGYIDSRLFQLKHYPDQNITYIGNITVSTNCVKYSTYCHGKGLLKYPDNSIYVGDFNHGREGHGVQLYPDGSKYIGDWINNSQHGDGIIQYTNGFRYIGQFADDCFHGFGCAIYPRGYIYIGQFNMGSREGLGILFNQHSGTVYIGEFHDNKFNGHGGLLWKDEFYYGNFKDNWKSGLGIHILLTTGYIFQGNFKNNIVHGSGLYYSINLQHQVKGYWRNGRLVKKEFEIKKQMKEEEALQI